MSYPSLDFSFLRHYPTTSNPDLIQPTEAGHKRGRLDRNPYGIGHSSVIQSSDYICPGSEVLWATSNPGVSFRNTFEPKNFVVYVRRLTFCYLKPVLFETELECLFATFHHRLNCVSDIRHINRTLICDMAA